MDRARIAVGVLAAGLLAGIMVALAPAAVLPAGVFVLAAAWSVRWTAGPGALSSERMGRAALFLVALGGLLLPVGLAAVRYARLAFAGELLDALIVLAGAAVICFAALAWPRRLPPASFLVAGSAFFLALKLAFVHLVLKAPEGDFANYWRLATRVSEGGLEALAQEDEYNLMLVPRVFPYFLPLVHLFGPEPSSFRVANVLATLLTAWIVFAFARDHFGLRPARVAFALSLLSFDPYLASTVSSHDVPGTLYTLAALLTFSKLAAAWRAGRWRRAALLSVAFGLLTYLANLQRNVGLFLVVACGLVALLTLFSAAREPGATRRALGRRELVVGAALLLVVPLAVLRGLAGAYELSDLPAHDRGDDVYLLMMGFSDSWSDGTFLFYEASYLLKGFSALEEARSPAFPLRKYLSDLHYNPEEHWRSYLRKARSFYTFERSDHYFLSGARLAGQGAMSERQRGRLERCRAYLAAPLFVLFLGGGLTVWGRRRLSPLALLPLLYLAVLSGSLILLSEIQPRYLHPVWFIAPLYAGALFTERRKPASPAARPPAAGLDILHVYKDYPPMHGGVEHHLRLLAESQARRGHQVSVLVTGRGWRTERSEEGGVRVIRAGRLATWAATPLAPALVRELARRTPDVTHLHAPYPPGEVAQRLVGRSRATVMTWHSDVVRQRFLERLYRPLRWRVLERIDLVLPTSTRYRESSPILSRLPPERCRVVPLGIDAERFQEPDTEKVALVRRRYGTPLILFVGRLRYYKGVDVLIRAVEEVEGAKLLIAGSGPMEEAWRRLAKGSPAARRIVFLGEVGDDELPALHAAADVFVLPSTERSEAYGLAQLEAMAAGTPVVSTELGTGTSVVNRDGETGLVVPPGDPGALAAALCRLLADEAARREMGERARRRARHELSAERMVATVEEVYRDALAGRSRSTLKEVR